MTAATRIYISLGLVVAILLLVIVGATAPIDNWVGSLFNSDSGLGTYGLWKKVSSFGKPEFIANLTILSSLLALLVGSRPTFWFLASCGVMSFITEPIVKFLVHRARPLELYPDTTPTSWSFPSGHALFSMTFYLSLAYVVGVLAGPRFSILARLIAVAAALLIAVSRLALGVHYLTDVVAGALIGFIIVETVSSLQNYRQK